MLALEDHRLLGEGRLGAGQVVHAEPGRQGHHGDHRHPDQAGVLQPQLAAIGQLLRLAAGRTEQAEADHQRHQELHRRYPQVAQPRVQAQRRTLLRLGIEEADVGHGRSKVAAAETAQQGDDHEHAVGGTRVLHGEAHPQRRNQQRGGADRGPATPAEDRHHERIEDPERGAGQPGQCRQPEQLVGAEAEADGIEPDDHRAPHHPHGEGQEQRRDRDPQVAGGDSLADGTPEMRVLGAPVLDHRPLPGRLPHGRILGYGHDQSPSSVRKRNSWGQRSRSP
ncbi:hypothetical protein FQZ97_902350 [compost metagenome]